jgi:hypothetical protein
MERTTGNGHHHAAASGIPAELTDGLEHAREQLEDFNRKALDFIQKRPIPVLIGAFCVGILLGRLASRR